MTDITMLVIARYSIPITKISLDPLSIETIFHAGILDLLYFFRTKIKVDLHLNDDPVALSRHSVGT